MVSEKFFYSSGLKIVARMAGHPRLRRRIATSRLHSRHGIPRCHRHPIDQTHRIRQGLIRHRLPDPAGPQDLPTLHRVTTAILTLVCLLSCTIKSGSADLELRGGVMHFAINTATTKILLCGGPSIDPESAVKLTATAGCTVGCLPD